MAIQVEGAGLYGDLDVTEPHVVRLTLYDSLPGRSVQDPAPPSGYRQVVYRAQVAPLEPGPYEVWVGRFDARQHVVEVPYEPLHVTVEPGTAADSTGRPPRSPTSKPRDPASDGRHRRRLPSSLSGSASDEARRAREISRCR
jgi:hypothetical protein